MIIHNCRVITFEKPNRILNGYGVLIRGDRIEEVSKENELLERFPAEERMDAKGQMLMPGLICAHTHFYGVFSRGMAIHGTPPKDFVEILEKLWWPLDQSLQKEDIYYSALVCLVDAIKHGATTLFDHHASPWFINGSLDVIESAVRQTGLRASLCYEVTDRGGEEKTDAGIAENLRMVKKLHSEPNGSLVTSMFGLHASLTLSDETLAKCQRLRPTGGYHIHVAEQQADEYDSLEKSGKRVIERLAQYGITGEDSIFAHGVHLDQNELSIIKHTRTWLTHQPRSNMNNAVGMADVEGSLHFGIPVCMGNDGFSFAMWDEWRTCYLAHKLWKRDPRAMNGADVIEMGAYNNARLASHFFRDQIGQVTHGYKADLILVDYQPITPLIEGNLPWQILFGFRDSMVTMTMVDGKVLMKNRQLVGLDETAISQRAVELSGEVWQRYNHQFGD